jgi:Bacterial Ig-like domain (group 3)
MDLKISRGFSLFGSKARPTLAAMKKGRRRPQARPSIEFLESRLTPSTYVWTALGDGQTWNDPNNWTRLGPSKPVGPPAVPTPYSDVIFPPIATLPTGSSTTINFNFIYLYMPLNSITIEGAYTFTGNPVTIDQSLSLANPFTPQSGATTATIKLAGVQLQPGVVVSAASGTTLQLGTTTTPTSLQLLLEGGLTKTGAGNLAIDTESVSYSNATTVQPIPVEINGGSITLGTSVNLAGVSFQINSQSGLVINDNVAARIQSLTGSGLVNLAGTTAAGDQTSLSVAVPIGTSDQFGGLIDGIGSFIMAGTGTLTTGTIDFSGSGGVQVTAGALDVFGSISAGSLQVSADATFGGLGLWNFSGAVVFQARSTFDVTFTGTTPGTQYTQLIDSNTTYGVNLANPTLMASVAYQFEQGDLFTIISAPLVTGAFQNVVAGQVILGTGVLFGASSSGTAVTLAPLQSETTTELESSTNPSNPGQIVSFTATVNTRTSPASSGTVSFLLGSTMLATVPLGNNGTATFSAASLPLGTYGITAVYNGAGGILSSRSAAVTQSVVPFKQTVNPLPTTTALNIVTQSLPHGRTEYVLVATVAPAGANPPTSPAGIVVFRRNGRTLGKAKIAGGVAQIVLGRSRPSSKLTFLAAFQGNSQFRASTSLPYRA